MKKKHILIVEDEQIVAHDIKISLERLGYDVSGSATSGEEAIKKAEETHPDIVLMDIVLKGKMDGIEAATIIRTRFDIPVVYLTAYVDDMTLERAKMTDPSGYILKPFEDNDVHSTIEIALYKHKIGTLLKESEEKYRTITDNVNVGIYRAISNPKGDFIEVNPAIVKMFGYKNKEEFLETNVVDLFQNPEDIEKLNEKISKNGHVKDEELGLKKKDGAFFIGSVSAVTVKYKKGEVCYHDGIIEDITERKRAEQELRVAKDKAERALKELRKVQSRLIQSERLAAVGELSAGVAHEINNPLNIISGNTEMLLMEENLDLEIEKTLEVIKEQVERASRITDQLLQFSKKTKPVIKKIDINEAVNNTLALIKHQLTLNSVEIVEQLSPEPVFIHADPSQIQQVFVNLIINASHAMPEGGTLTLRTEVKDSNVEIKFIDTGCGIPEKDLSKLFEPFFTTKEKGAGLGLSIVYGIIEAHKGSIRVESRVGKGTTFTIALPVEKGVSK